MSGMGECLQLKYPRKVCPKCLSDNTIAKHSSLTATALLTDRVTTAEVVRLQCYQCNIVIGPTYYYAKTGKKTGPHTKYYMLQVPELPVYLVASSQKLFAQVRQLQAWYDGMFVTKLSVHSLASMYLRSVIKQDLLLAGLHQPSSQCFRLGKLGEPLDAKGQWLMQAVDVHMVMEAAARSLGTWDLQQRVQQDNPLLCPFNVLLEQQQQQQPPAQQLQDMQAAAKLSRGSQGGHAQGLRATQASAELSAGSGGGHELAQQEEGMGAAAGPNNGSQGLDAQQQQGPEEPDVSEADEDAEAEQQRSRRREAPRLTAAQQQQSRWQAHHAGIKQPIVLAIINFPRGNSEHREQHGQQADDVVDDDDLLQLANAAAQEDEAEDEEAEAAGEQQQQQQQQDAPHQADQLDLAISWGARAGSPQSLLRQLLVQRIIDEHGALAQGYHTHCGAYRPAGAQGTCVLMVDVTQNVETAACGVPGCTGIPVTKSGVDASHHRGCKQWCSKHAAGWQGCPVAVRHPLHGWLPCRQLPAATARTGFCSQHLGMRATSGAAVRTEAMGERAAWGSHRHDKHPSRQLVGRPRLEAPATPPPQPPGGAAAAAAAAAHGPARSVDSSSSDGSRRHSGGRSIDSDGGEGQDVACVYVRPRETRPLLAVTCAYCGCVCGFGPMWSGAPELSGEGLADVATQLGAILSRCVPPASVAAGILPRSVVIYNDAASMHNFMEGSAPQQLKQQFKNVKWTCDLLRYLPTIKAAVSSVAAARQAGRAGSMSDGDAGEQLLKAQQVSPFRAELGETLVQLLQPQQDDRIAALVQQLQEQLPTAGQWQALQAMTDQQRAHADGVNALQYMLLRLNGARLNPAAVSIAELTHNGVLSKAWLNEAGLSAAERSRMFIRFTPPAVSQQGGNSNSEGGTSRGDRATAAAAAAAAAATAAAHATPGTARQTAEGLNSSRKKNRHRSSQVACSDDRSARSGAAAAGHAAGNMDKAEMFGHHAKRHCLHGSSSSRRSSVNNSNGAGSPACAVPAAAAGSSMWRIEVLHVLVDTEGMESLWSRCQPGMTISLKTQTHALAQLWAWMDAHNRQIRQENKEMQTHADTLKATSLQQQQQQQRESQQMNSGMSCEAAAQLMGQPPRRLNLEQLTRTQLRNRRNFQLPNAVSGLLLLQQVQPFTGLALAADNY